MDDLVKRLEEACCDPEAVCHDCALHREAAARIRELEDDLAAMARALRLIELLGYREGEELGWIVAHMRGVANDALEGRASEHIWRLFPRHRAAMTDTPEGGEHDRS